MDTSRKLPGPENCEHFPHILDDWGAMLPTAMNEKQWNSPLNLTLLIDKVYIQRLKAVDLDLGTIVGQLVELGLLLSPVVALLPVFYEPLDVCERGAVVPSGVVEFIGEGGGRELLGEGGELLVGYRDGIRLHCTDRQDSIWVRGYLMFARCLTVDPSNRRRCD